MSLWLTSLWLTYGVSKNLPIFLICKFVKQGNISRIDLMTATSVIKSASKIIVIRYNQIEPIRCNSSQLHRYVISVTYLIFGAKRVGMLCGENCFIWFNFFMYCFYIHSIYMLTTSTFAASLLLYFSVPIIVL